MLWALAVFAVIAAIELPSLVRRRQWGELVLVILFLGAGMALTAFLGLGGTLPKLQF